MTATDGIRVGVLSLHNSKETKAILNAIEDLGHRPAWLRKENTAIEISEGRVLLEPEIDVVANRLLLTTTEQPCEELGLASTFAAVRPILNPPMATMRAFHKYAAATVLAEAGVSVPDALLALDTDRLNDSRERFGEEVVFKTAIGTHGGGTWKVAHNEPVNAEVGNRRAFLQRLIERDGEHHRDLRVYLVGDRVLGAMSREAPENDWRTNVALGGNVSDVSEELPEEVVRMARTAREVLGLDYAGVDVVEGEDGWYVLEVNPTAGFKGFFEATGVSPAPYIAKQAIELGGGSVDDDHVVELSRTLDDSIPTAKPRSKGPTGPKEPVVVGYTEEVVVTGTSGSTTTVAKSDTGATRTSIDTKLAAEIGAGPIKDIIRIKSGSSPEGRQRALVDIVVGVGGTQHTVTASIEDRSHMDYPLLLGRDILEHYQVDVRKRADAEEPESEE